LWSGQKHEVIAKSIIGHHGTSHDHSNIMSALIPPPLNLTVLIVPVVIISRRWFGVDPFSSVSGRSPIALNHKNLLFFLSVMDSACFPKAHNHFLFSIAMIELIVPQAFESSPSLARRHPPNQPSLFLFSPFCDHQFTPSSLIWQLNTLVETSEHSQLVDEGVEFRLVCVTELYHTNQFGKCWFLLFSTHWSSRLCFHT